MSIEDWGLIDYREAFRKQDEDVQKIISGEKKETLVFCSHPPIVTLGRGTKPGDVFAWRGDTLEVNRGGRATYHGPSQLIMYPLISLEPGSQFIEKKTKPKDLHQYMRVIEESVIEVLSLVGVKSQGRTMQQQVGEEFAEEATGVWVNDQKIASIGIAVKRWVTSHGCALNLYEDPQAFQGMNPCGFKSEQMTNLERLLGQKVDRAEMVKLWAKTFLKLI